MTVIISTCRYRLSEEEFVRPLAGIVEKYGYEVEIRNYKEPFTEESFAPSENVIISGTALKDFDYLNYLKNFEWIKDFGGKIIGICAGAQIISSVFGCRLGERKIIGAFDIEVKKETKKGKRRAYFLISKLPELNDNFEVLGRLDDVPVYFKVKGKEIYGVLFHPEVLNQELIVEFLGL